MRRYKLAVASVKKGADGNLVEGQLPCQQSSPAALQKICPKKTKIYIFFILANNIIIIKR